MTTGLNKKIALPLVLIILALAAGGGWLLWQQKREAPKTTGQQATKGAVYYTCSMHPSIIKDKPGVCPICGMELIKKISAAPAASAPAPAEAEEADMANHVSLSPAQRVMADVATAEATTEVLNKEISAVGTVQYDQSRQSKVTAWSAGRIDKLIVSSVGATVSRQMPVAEIYSPDLVAAQQEYLLALRSRDLLKNQASPYISGEGVVASSRERLRLLGVRDAQIARLERSGRPELSIPVYSPFSGIVIEKMVVQGEYVTAGTVLFNITDLSSVWVEIELYENEFSSVRKGQEVEIRSQSLPGKTFTGRISFLYPFLDPKTRTLKARVQMANPGLSLKPDMFVNAIVRVPFSPAVVVPRTAVMDSGKRQVVWVESSPGMFEARSVQVGAESGNKVQILSGLGAGERVAVSGGYLIDSESQLKGGGDEDGRK